MSSSEKNLDGSSVSSSGPNLSDLEAGNPVKFGMVAIKEKIAAC